MIKLQAKRFELNFLLKLSDLKSNFTLTLGYDPALNNPGLIFNSRLKIKRRVKNLHDVLRSSVQNM